MHFRNVIGENLAAGSIIWGLPTVIRLIWSYYRWQLCVAKWGRPLLFFTIWPLFAVICLGFLLAQRGFPDLGFWPAAEKLNYFISFPALLLSNLANSPVREPEVLRLGGAAIVIIVIDTCSLFIFRFFHAVPAARFGPVLQGTVRFNSYLGLSILTTLAGPLGVGGFLHLLSQGSLPLGLLCVGAALQPEALRRDALVLGTTGALRLLAMPVLAASVGYLFGLEGVEALVLVVFSAILTAPTSYVLTRQMNRDGMLMAGIVTSQTLFAIITLPLILWIFSFQETC